MAEKQVQTYYLRNDIPVRELVEAEKNRAIKNILNIIELECTNIPTFDAIRQVVLDQVNGFARFINTVVVQDGIDNSKYR